MRRATSSFRRRSWPCRCSSMVRAMTAAPCSRPARRSRRLVRPVLDVQELMMTRPGAVFERDLEHLGLGRVDDQRHVHRPCSSFLTTCASGHASSGRSVSATQTSSMCAPPSTCSRPSVEDAVVVLGQQQLLDLACCPARCSARRSGSGGGSCTHGDRLTWPRTRDAARLTRWRAWVRMPRRFSTSSFDVLRRRAAAAAHDRDVDAARRTRPVSSANGSGSSG